jgi:hypothetical protein
MQKPITIEVYRKGSSHFDCHSSGLLMTSVNGHKSERLDAQTFKFLQVGIYHRLFDDSKRRIVSTTAWNTNSV